jgi:hypothetical protein
MPKTDYCGHGWAKSDAQPSGSNVTFRRFDCRRFDCSRFLATARQVSTPRQILRTNASSTWNRFEIVQWQSPRHLSERITPTSACVRSLLNELFTPEVGSADPTLPSVFLPAVGKDVRGPQGWEGVEMARTALEIVMKFPF